MHSLLFVCPIHYHTTLTSLNRLRVALNCTADSIDHVLRVGLGLRTGKERERAEGIPDHIVEQVWEARERFDRLMVELADTLPTDRLALGALANWLTVVTAVEMAYYWVDIPVSMDGFDPDDHDRTVDTSFHFDAPAPEGRVHLLDSKMREKCAFSDLQDEEKVLAEQAQEGKLELRLQDHQRKKEMAPAQRLMFLVWEADQHPRPLELLKEFGSLLFQTQLKVERLVTAKQAVEVMRKFKALQEAEDPDSEADARLRDRLLDMLTE